MCHRNALSAFTTKCQAVELITAIIQNTLTILVALFHIRIFSSKNIRAKGMRKGARGNERILY